MNIELFRLINNLAYKNKALDLSMMFISKYVPYIFMAAVAALFILGIVKKDTNYRKVAFSIFVITVINLIIGFFIGIVYYENRPFVHNKVNLLYSHVNDASFPSDHATGTMSIALGLRKYNKVLSFVSIILSLIVGFSRVYVGHHYPMDIIGAYLIVYITGYIYKKRLRSKVENLYQVIERKLAVKLRFEQLYSEV